MSDIKLIYTEEGFTIGITNGDLTEELGFDTAINMSLLTDARAPSDSIQVPEKRRGWLGNTVSQVPGRQQGSLLWLINQRKLISDTVNKAINYSKSALNWLVEDGLAISVKVFAEIVPLYGIKLSIVITHNNGETSTHYRNLWELTGS